MPVTLLPDPLRQLHQIYPCRRHKARWQRLEVPPDELPPRHGPAEGTGHGAAHKVGFWSTGKPIFNIPLAEQAVDHIESYLLPLQEQFCGLPMCLAEPTTQTQDDVIKLAEYQHWIATNRLLASQSWDLSIKSLQ